MQTFVYLTALVAALTTSVSARACVMVSSVSQSAPQGFTRCPGSPIVRGNAALTIDGRAVWQELGGNDQYEALSNGDGYAWEVEGVSFHVLSLGIPTLTTTPRCEMKLLDKIHVGVGSHESGAGTPNLSDTLRCRHDWEC